MAKGDPKSASGPLTYDTKAKEKAAAEKAGDRAKTRQLNKFSSVLKTQGKALDPSFFGKKAKDLGLSQKEVEELPAYKEYISGGGKPIFGGESKPEGK